MVAAVILFALIYLNCANSPLKSQASRPMQEVRNIVEEGLSAASGNGVLGGPVNLSAAVIPAAQAAYDFTSDDAQENNDYLLLEGSSLVSQDSPVPPSFNQFGTIDREVKTYVVQNGDTPSDIAIKFGINTDTFLWANSLRDGDVIRPGDKVRILPINGVRVKVGAKDTVDTLAKKYSGKTDEIIAFNDLINNELKSGNLIIIPNGEITLPSVSKKPKITVPLYATANKLVDSWLIAPASGYDWGRVHSSNGVDIANVCGTPVYAAAEGKVTLSDGIGWNGGYGKYIKIQHTNGVVTLYGHSSQLLVNVGDEVSQGQLITLMGTTGRSTGCHLHFEVRGARNPMAR